MLAIVDDEDFQWLSQWNWMWKNDKVTRVVCVSKYKCKDLFMHRLVACARKGQRVAHKNKNKLDCRRSNLLVDGRPVGPRPLPNVANPRSQYMGVYMTHNGLWEVRVGRERLLRHWNEDVCALAYNHEVYKRAKKDGRVPERRELNYVAGSPSQTDLPLECSPLPPRNPAPNVWVRPNGNLRVVMYFDGKKYSKDGFTNVVDAIRYRNELCEKHCQPLRKIPLSFHR